MVVVVAATVVVAITIILLLIIIMHIQNRKTGCVDWDTTQARTKATRKVGIRHAHKDEEKDWDRGRDEDKNT